MTISGSAAIALRGILVNIVDQWRSSGCVTDFQFGWTRMNVTYGPVLLACLLAASGAVSTAGASNPELPGREQSEPTLQDCILAVERARELANALPPDDLARYFAERNLQQAMTEAGNGEFDDCLEWAEQA